MVMHTHIYPRHSAAGVVANESGSLYTVVHLLHGSYAAFAAHGVIGSSERMTWVIEAIAHPPPPVQ